MKIKKVGKKSMHNFWGFVTAVSMILPFVFLGAAVFINDSTFDTNINLYIDDTTAYKEETNPFNTMTNGWNVNLDLMEYSGKIDQVIFSEATDANDGAPPDSHDEPKPPPPMPPYVRGWFNDGLPTPYNYLHKDCRHYPDINKTWDLYVQWKSSSSNSTNITILWNESEIDDCEYTSIVLTRYDPFDDEWDFAANMLTEEEYVYTPRYFASTWLTDHFQINATGGFENGSPYEPSNPSPENESININITEDLSWIGGDPDPGDTVTYDVYFGLISPPPQVASGQPETTYTLGIMHFNMKYYWRIVAWDSYNFSTSGPIWEFTTESIPNNPPYKPSSPSPSDNATDIPLDVNLNWTGGDPDGDPVTYDVYFDTSDPPENVVNNQTQTFYDPGILQYDTRYFWKIIAWDDSNASNENITWSFTTKINYPPTTPIIDGLTEGEAGTQYEYIFISTDPEGATVFYYIDWDDGTYEEWIGPYSSGEEVTVTHCWDEEGSYTIRAKAKDTNDAESDWGTLEVTMPKSYPSLFVRFFERFPNVFPIVRYMIGILI